MQNDYNAIHHAEIYSNGVWCIYIHCLENKQYQLFVNTTNVPKSCEFKVMGGFLGTFSDQFILTAHQFPYAHKLCGHEQKVSQYSHLRKKTEQELSPVALS